MDAKLAIEILTNWNNVRIVDLGGKSINITTTETLSDVADFIEQCGDYIKLGKLAEKACNERFNKENKCWNLNSLNEIYELFCEKIMTKEREE